MTAPQAWAAPCRAAHLPLSIKLDPLQPSSKFLWREARLAPSFLPRGGKDTVPAAQWHAGLGVGSGRQAKGLSKAKAQQS